VPIAAETQHASDAWQVAGWIALGVAFASAGWILYAMYGRGQRPHMRIMEAVWPITALYWGPVAVWFFRRRQREREDRPAWETSATGTTHCGAGCTLGDIAGEWIVYATGFTIAIFAAHDANSLMAMFALDFAFAWTFGVVFQYFSIVPMRDDLGRLAGIWAAIKADTLSIVAFQIGLFGFMALFHLVLWQPPLTAADPTYWMMMQVGMIIGFFTSWPVNVWLIRVGWKEAM
jgi:Domain of unknown function (DUF4396)